MKSVAWLAIALATGALRAQSVSFRAQTDYRTSISHCCSILSGDFRKTGSPDVIVGSASLALFANETGSTTPLLLLENRGDGTFDSKPVSVPYDSFLILVAAADVNGDSKLDLIALQTGGSPGARSVLLLGNGDGTFSAPLDLGTDMVVGVADVNGDQKPDLIVTPGGFEFHARFGHGDGTFDPPVYNAFSYFATPVSIGDLNGDGIPDVVAQSPVFSEEGNLFVAFGKRDGTFSGTRLNPRGNAGVLIGDFNHDERPDIAQVMSIRRGRGDGTFADPVVSSYGAGLPFAAADFNGDGNLDIVGGVTGAPGFAISLGNGDLTMQPPLSFGRVSMTHPPELDDRRVLAVADFNGDGKPDLAIPVEDGRIAVLLNDSPGPLPVTPVSAADWTARLAPGSSAAAFGSSLASTKEIRVRDGEGGIYKAQLLYVSATQINFVVPENVAPGYATFVYDNGTGIVEESAHSTLIEPVAPTFFRADGSSNGVPIAYVVRTDVGGQTWIPAFTCDAKRSCHPVPIDMGPNPANAYLVLFGTGIRHQTPNQALACYFSRAGEGAAPHAPTYAGPQGQYPGLDQLNIPLGPDLKGIGSATLTCTFYFENLPFRFFTDTDPLSVVFR